jgi:hypothetical protein
MTRKNGDATRATAEDAKGPTLDGLRAEVSGLAEKRSRGDLTEKAFRRRALQLSVELARMEAGAASPGEAILAEHHVVHSHFRLTESLMREPEQTTVSYFATERRLVRVQGSLVTGRAPTTDETNGDLRDPARVVVDSVPYDRLRRIERRVEWRWGEVATGLVIVLAALLLRGLLAVTGPVLVLLGVAGMTHGLLMPTRWAEIVVDDEDLSPLAMHGIWKRSGRHFLAVVNAGLRRQQGSA